MSENQTTQDYAEVSLPWLDEAERHGAICKSLAYKREPPQHYGPNRTRRWLEGYDNG